MDDCLPIASALQSFQSWSAAEIDLLADSAARLLPHSADIARGWAMQWTRRAPAPHGESIKEITEACRQLLEQQLESLRARRVDRVLEDILERTLEVLQTPGGLAPGERSSLDQLHLWLEIATAEIVERLRFACGGEGLPAVLALYHRLSLALARVVGTAFQEVRAEASQNALRAVSSLLESSRELNRSSASVDAVLSDMTHIVRRFVACDHSVAFLWRAIERTYVAEAGHGFADRELFELRRLRLRRGDFPLVDKVLEGAIAAGGRDDGPHEMMERLGAATYAIAPIVSAHGKPLGALAIFRSEATRFGEIDLEIVKGVAQNASMAIENAMLVEHLQASVRFKSDLINSAPDAMIIADGTGRIVLVNDQAVELFGHPREDLLGRSIEVLVPAGLLEPAGGGFADVRSTSSRLRRDLSGRRKDGSEFPIEVSLSPMRRDEGALVTTAIRDLTERKRFEAELAHARDAALDSVRLKSAFLANMSHEIRTPLNVIGGYTQLIGERLEELGDDSERDTIDAIQRASRRLIRTVQSILDMSKIETSTFEVNPVLIQLPTLVDQIVQEFRESVKSKGLSIDCDIRERGAAVLFDEYCLTQALLNLLDNALKFTERGGITLRLERGADGGLRLEVHDTGVGIDESYRARLFERFSQEESGHTRRFEGNGLGLALVKGYLELNGAKLIVESEKNKGSVFTIRFGDAGKSSARGTQPEVRRAPLRPCVLVVEDDPETQNFMSALLGRSYEVLLASSADEMWQRLDATAGQIRLVLMDLSLKGDVDGLELTRTLRKHATWKTLPILAVTAHAMPQDRGNVLAAGCDAYVEKPIDNQRLLALIERFLARSTSPVGEPASRLLA